jgi:MOSC domain-containing protein YiiM/GNAT superfamily N-acetyltransferase
MVEAGGEGRVLQVNVSPGGVPKLPVAEARVGPLGLEGDDHRAYWAHGGPLRAVSLFAIEAIERVQADGHPIEPGSTGENLTTTGIELARLAVASRLAIGAEVLLEVTSPAMPCDTIRGSFRDGRSGRISILLHPDDSRIYARVLRGGVVRPGDPIRVLPADPASDAPLLRLLADLDRVERHSAVARWAAAERLGYPIRWVDDGDLAYAVSRELESPVFASIHGMRVVPNVLPRVLREFDEAGATGWIHWPADTPPTWADAGDADLTLVVHATSPDDVLRAAAAEPAIPGLTIREVGPAEAALWAEAPEPAADRDDRRPRSLAAEAWHATTPLVAETPGHHLFLAELDGRPVGAGLLVRRGRTGLIRAGAVHPDARGRGIQRALIAARARVAGEHGCDTVSSHAEPDSTSIRNLAALGFRPVHTTHVYRRGPRAADPDRTPLAATGRASILGTR